MLVTGLTEQGRRGAVSALTELSFHYEKIENKQGSRCIIRNYDDAMKHKNFGGNLQRGLRGGDIEANPERAEGSNRGGKKRFWAERMA